MNEEFFDVYVSNSRSSGASSLRWEQELSLSAPVECFIVFR